MTLRWLLSFGRKVGAELTLTGEVRASDVVRLRQQIDWLIETMNQDASESSQDSITGEGHDPIVTAASNRSIDHALERIESVVIPNAWELTGQPGDVMLRCGASVNVFAVSAQDIFVGGLPLPEWAAKTGRTYISHQLDGRVCVTLSGYAGDRIRVAGQVPGKDE